jgi:pimeloyl-ACP methyl ester carboxylesterase
MSPYRTDTEQRGEWEPIVTRLQPATEHGMEAYVALMEKSGISYTRAVRERLLSNDPLALFAAAKSLLIWQSAEDVLPKINVPCLVYAGEDDGFCPGAKRASLALPHAQFNSFPGLNHSQTTRASHLIIPLVQNFLAKLENK